MSKKKTSQAAKKQSPRNPLPPQKRQRGSATKADKRTKFVDVPMVQKTFFDLDQGGVK